MPERTLLEAIVDRLEAGLPVTVYILDPTVTADTLGVTGAGASDVTPLVYPPNAGPQVLPQSEMGA
jgi:hypothetical protein